MHIMFHQTNVNKVDLLIHLLLSIVNPVGYFRSYFSIQIKKKQTIKGCTIKSEIKNLRMSNFIQRFQWSCKLEEGTDRQFDGHEDHFISNTSLNRLFLSGLMKYKQQKFGHIFYSPLSVSFRSIYLKRLHILRLEF